MRRRRFVKVFGTAALGAVAAGSGVASAQAETVEFFSTCSLLDARGERLGDDDLVGAWAEDAARNEDADWNYDAVDYGSDPIPLMAVDGGVAGFGSVLVADGEVDEGYDNRGFYLDVWDSLVSGSTVLWDESHGQYWGLDSCSELASAAADRGYDVRRSWDLESDLDRADAVVMTPPADYVYDSTANALREFVADGGVVFLHDQSDYSDYDETARLNYLCRTLDVGFRFNDDQVVDDRNNAGAPYEVTTTKLPYSGGGGGGGDTNDPPAAAFSVSDGTPSVGTDVTFDASGSSDPDGSIASYAWDFGDGYTGSGRTVDHYFDAQGSYTVTLTVTDDDGATATASTTIEAGSGGGGGGTPGRTQVEVTGVSDGDTISVRYQGSEESIRVLGIDTAEKPSNQNAERVQEWEGIESLSYLGNWGQKGTDYAKQRFSAGDTVEISFDEAEGKRDPFNRLLAYVHYDPDGDGNYDTLYNREIVADGRARVYGSSLTKHDEIWNAERKARDAGSGVWGQSDPKNSSTVRNGPVDQLFVPDAAAIETASGVPAASRVPVFAESTASANGISGTPPLVAVDEDANVATVGGLLIDESYEKSEGYAVDTSGYGNFAFLTDLVDYVGGGTGPLVIDGGHGQFGAEFALSSEDAAYYGRYLEGVDLGLEQVNDLANPPVALSNFRAVIVTPPTSAFSSAETSALSTFASNGGTVVLMGAGSATSAARKRLNDLASALGSDLRLGGAVTDSSNNLNGERSVPVTANFETSFPLFSGY